VEIERVIQHFAKSRAVFFFEILPLLIFFLGFLE
jgi:hypothetical protein